MGVKKAEKARWKVNSSTRLQHGIYFLAYYYELLSRNSNKVYILKLFTVNEINRNDDV